MDRWVVGSQIAVAAVAAAAAVVALYVGAKDRKNARNIADTDRRHAVVIAKAAWDRQALVRLVELAGREALRTPSPEYILEIRGLLAGLGGDRVPSFRAYEADYGQKVRNSILNGIPALQKDILRELRTELDALQQLE